MEAVAFVVGIASLPGRGLKHHQARREILPAGDSHVDVWIETWASQKLTHRRIVTCHALNLRMPDSSRRDSKSHSICSSIGVVVEYKRIV